MKQHQHIITEMERQYANLAGAIVVGPKALAFKVHSHFLLSRTGKKRPVEPHIQYASLEHMTAMARRFLAKRNDPNDDENEVYGQGSFQFSGKLQERYPIPRKPGEEPLYKKRSALTAEERGWNVRQLRKSAKFRQEHADALEAEALGRTTPSRQPANRNSKQNAA